MAIAEDSMPAVPATINVTFRDNLFQTLVNKARLLKPDFNPDNWDMNLATGRTDSENRNALALVLTYRLPEGADPRKYRNTKVELPISEISWEDYFHRFGLESEYHYSQFDEVKNLLTRHGFYTEEYTTSETNENTRILHVYPYFPSSENIAVIRPAREGEEERDFDYYGPGEAANKGHALTTVTSIHTPSSYVSSGSEPAQFGNCFIKFSREAVTETINAAEGLDGKSITLDNSDIEQ